MGGGGKGEADVPQAQQVSPHKLGPTFANTLSNKKLEPRWIDGGALECI